MWVGVDDGLYLFKNGRFRRLPEPDHQPLGMVFALIEDIDGNIWAECGSKPRKLVRIRDFQVREVFPTHKFRLGIPSPRIHMEEFGLRLKGRFRTVSQRRSGNKGSAERGSSSLNRQIMVEADGSVLAGFDDGLVDCGKVKCSG